MLQKSHRLRTLLQTVLLLGLSGAAIADLPIRVAVNAPVAPAASAATVPGNSVDCVYSMLSSDDREIALLLFEREVASGVKFHTGSPNLKVIERLVEEARAKCAVPYSWSSVRADAAISYAMNELMSTGISQSLEAKGKNSVLIDAYYAKHRAGLAGIEKIEGAMADEFRAFLIEQGWSKSEPSTFLIAEFYLEALLARERQTRIFSAAAVHPAATSMTKSSRLPYRARSTRRGRP